MHVTGKGEVAFNLEFRLRDTYTVSDSVSKQGRVLDEQQSGRSSMKYRIALQKSEEGYAVSVPGLPGCWSQGATEQEAIENIQNAIREYLTVVEDEIRGQDVREIEVAV